MKSFRLHHAILAIVLALVITAAAGIESIWTQRNLEVLPDMVTSVPVEAQSIRWNAAMSTRSANPVPGTISRTTFISSDGPPYSDPSASDSARLEWKRRAEKRGNDVYNVFCVPCHGTSGAGDGVITQRGYPPPPSLTAENALRLSDSDMYGIIVNGRANMPRYSSQIIPDDIWASILHVRALQQDSPQAGGTEQ